MQKSAISTIVKLAIVSLLVGFALVLFGIEPADLVKSLGSTVVKLYELVLSFMRASMKYVLIGAVVVVPIWLVFYLIGLAKRKKSGS
jgi:hypothetical protein